MDEGRYDDRGQVVLTSKRGSDDGARLILMGGRVSQRRLKPEPQHEPQAASKLASGLRGKQSQLGSSSVGAEGSNFEGEGDDGRRVGRLWILQAWALLNGESRRAFSQGAARLDARN